MSTNPETIQKRNKKDRESQEQREEQLRGERTAKRATDQGHGRGDGCAEESRGWAEKGAGPC